MIGFLFSHWEYIALILAMGGAAFSVFTWIPSPLRKHFYTAIFVVGLVMTFNLAWSDIKKYYTEIGREESDNQKFVEDAKQKEKSFNEVLTIRKKQDEIRNNAIDDNDLADSLRNNTF